MTRYSILDLVPIAEGGTASDALANSAGLARHADALGYTRYWVAEHHNMPGIASAATAVVVGHLAAATSRIRIGAGGIMLPNHAPLVVAEQFGTLDALFPGRIDLGLGRAPGSDGATMRAMRRGMGADDFPAEVMELMGYLGDARPGAAVRAVPGQGSHVPLWILGSSLYGAQLAAHLGLPYAFASHFAPDALAQAAQIYRERFTPSDVLAKPYFMMAINVFAGEDDAHGAYLRTSSQQSFANLRLGRPGPLPRPVEDIAALLPPQILHGVNHALGVAAVGGPRKVRRDLEALIVEFAPDEVLLAGAIHDSKARQRSYAIAADAMQTLGAVAA
jgi:luciferase family oxidoreductase group 1